MICPRRLLALIVYSIAWFCIAPGESVFTDKGKKRNSTCEKKSQREKLVRGCDNISPTEPWVLTHAQPWASKEVKLSELTDEQREFMNTFNEERAMSSGKSGDAKEATSFFHGKETKDYAGETEGVTSVLNLKHNEELDENDGHMNLLY